MKGLKAFRISGIGFEKLNITALNEIQSSKLIKDQRKLRCLNQTPELFQIQFLFY